MDYHGPQAADYENVRALNGAFLALLAGGRRGAALLRDLPAPLAERCLTLTALQRERLARTPFLLLSFREEDAERWSALLGGGHSLPLNGANAARDAAQAGLTHAALGFVWQLARLNPYTARLICGASLHWCELLADRPLIDIIALASADELLAPRRAADACLWRKLLYEGTAAERAVRDAARISALHRVLTTSAAATPARHALAARRFADTGVGRSGREDH